MSKKQTTDDYLLSIRKKKKILAELIDDYLSHIQSESMSDRLEKGRYLLKKKKNN